MFSNGWQGRRVPFWVKLATMLGGAALAFASFVRPITLSGLGRGVRGVEGAGKGYLSPFEGKAQPNRRKSGARDCRFISMFLHVELS